MSNVTKYEQQHKDLETLRAMAAVAVRSGKYNATDYNEATILNIFMTARALGVDPMLALNGGFNIIKGKINMGAHFMSALARRAGHSIKVVEMTAEKCVIIAKRKDNEDSIKYEMTMDEARAAGLTGKDNWRNNPKQMLYCGAIRNVFRILFSDIAIPYDADEMNVEDVLHQPDDVGVMDAPIMTVQAATGEIIDSRPNKEAPEGSYESLREQLELEGIDPQRLEEWVKLRCQAKGEKPEVIIKACLAPEILPKFKSSYAKWLTAAQQQPEQAAV